MSGAGTSVGVVVVAVGEIGAAVQEEAETALAELIAISLKVVGAELVNNDDDYQLGTRIISRCPGSGCQYQHYERSVPAMGESHCELVYRRGKPLTAENAEVAEERRGRSGAGDGGILAVVIDDLASPAFPLRPRRARRFKVFNFVACSSPACIQSRFSATVNSMLDLNFVRDNLPLVEEKLRQRGMDPAEVLKDFNRWTAQRREAITAAETMKARRNRASEEIAKLKRAGRTPARKWRKPKNCAKRFRNSEKTAGDLDERLQEILAAIPNLPTTQCLLENADDNVEVRRWGTPPKFDFTPKPHWEIGEAAWCAGSGAGGKAVRCAFRRLLGLGAKLERALANFMLDLHTASMDNRSASAVLGEFGFDVRHGAAAEICR